MLLHLSKPISDINPGKNFKVYTGNTFKSRITKNADVSSVKLNMPYLNPMIGPFYVKGQKKVDSILKIFRGGYK